jgi:hypothetical protein
MSVRMPRLAFQHPSLATVAIAQMLAAIACQRRRPLCQVDLSMETSSSLYISDLYK